MTNPVFSSPFCEERLKASFTTLPAVGRLGHCASTVVYEHPQIRTISKYLNVVRKSNLLACRAIRGTPKRGPIFV
jgi:hypothetical protein